MFGNMARKKKPDIENKKCCTTVDRQKMSEDDRSIIAGCSSDFSKTVLQKSGTDVEYKNMA